MTLRYVMAPEEDAGGTGAAAAVAEPPASSPEATPAPADPEAISPVPDEPAAGEEAPAVEGDGEPAGDEGEAPPERLEEETWAELYRLEPERDPKNIEARLRRELAETARTPEAARDNDPLYRTIKTDSDAAFQYIAQAVNELDEGGFTQDPRQLAAVMDLADVYGATAERRGQIMLNRAVFERESGIDAAKVNRVVAGDADPETLDGLERDYADALMALDREQVAAYRTQQSALSVFDGAKRKDLAQRAQLRDATATGEFAHALIKLAREAGKIAGRKEAEKGLDRRIETTASKARTNGRTEALAKARNAAAAGRAMSSASAPGQPAQDNSKAARQQRLAYGGATPEDRAWLREYQSQF